MRRGEGPQHPGGSLAVVRAWVGGAALLVLPIGVLGMVIRLGTFGQPGGGGPRVDYSAHNLLMLAGLGALPGVLHALSGSSISLGNREPFAWAWWLRPVLGVIAGGGACMLTCLVALAAPYAVAGAHPLLTVFVLLHAPLARDEVSSVLGAAAVLGGLWSEFLARKVALVGDEAHEDGTEVLV